MKLGRLISQRLRHHVVLVRILLFSLSTRLGTFIFGGGTRSFSCRFPFFLKFSELPLENRQQFILALASHWFFLFRMAFFGVKLLILIAFFTQVLTLTYSSLIFITYSSMLLNFIILFK